MKCLFSIHYWVFIQAADQTARDFNLDLHAAGIREYDQWHTGLNDITYLNQFVDNTLVSLVIVKITQPDY